jgi:hypothetical protein
MVPIPPAAPPKAIVANPAPINFAAINMISLYNIFIRIFLSFSDLITQHFPVP